MTETNTGKCRSTCWKGAAAAGALLFVILFLTAGFGFFSALLIGLVFYGGLGLTLSRMVCGDTAESASVSQSAASASTSTAASPAAAAALRAASLAALLRRRPCRRPRALLVRLLPLLS